MPPQALEFKNCDEIVREDVREGPEASEASEVDPSSRTPLYFTASSPFVLPPRLATDSLFSNSRSFYSLPNFTSSWHSDEHEYHSLETRDETSVGKLKKEKKKYHGGFRLQSPRTKYLEKQSYSRSKVRAQILRGVNEISDSGILLENSIPSSDSTTVQPERRISFHAESHPSAAPEPSSSYSNVPRLNFSQQNAPSSQKDEDNIPSGSSLKSPSSRSGKSAHPYSSGHRRASGKRRSWSVSAGCVTQAELPPSPQEQYWLTSSQNEVSLLVYGSRFYLSSNQGFKTIDQGSIVSLFFISNLLDSS